MARPRKKISKEQFESMCAYQCAKREICAFLNVSDKTLDEWCKRTYDKSFSDVFKQKREIGKISLRRSQFKLAEKNVAMAIFLGKNYLGQSDKVEVQTNDNDLVLQFIQGMKNNDPTE